LWMSGLAYYILTLTLVTQHGRGSIIATALGRRIKEIGSLVAYTVAIVFAFINTNVSLAIYFLVALMWLIPDTRIEKTLGQ
jgi:uncharacterized membrane protein